MTIRPALSSDVSSLALIHFQSLPDDFLPSLGQDFLERVYYPVALASKYAKTLVIERDGPVAGFVTIAHESDQFSRDVLRNQWVAIAQYALRAALQRPSHVIKSFEVLWSVLFSTPDPVNGEIVFIAVRREYRHQGLGQCLVKSALEYLRSRGVFECRTKTLADNSSVIKMYEKMGWHVRNHLHLLGREYVIIATLSNPK